jgi:hypothetical protein|tara:strand:- start:493 stop:1260 length:768 start_codon:yes stop_codon:yes gene_type:complete
MNVISNQLLKIQNANFKYLLVSGCSFTVNDYIESIAWPNFLADWTGTEVINLAVASGGSNHISKSIMYYIETHQLPIEETFVIAMWSGVDRASCIADSSLYTVEQRQHPTFDYDEYNTYCAFGALDWGPTTALAKSYKEIQSANSLSLDTYLNIISLQNYLQNKNYRYAFIPYSNIFEGYSDFGAVNFLKQLKKLGLKLNTQDWICTKPRQTLDEYSLYHDMRAEDGKHPSMKAHEQWTKTILMPLLTKQGILSA